MTDKPKFDDIDYIDPEWGVLPRMPEQDTDELLPCPFCGGEAEINHINHCYEWFWEARCPDCGCGTDGCDEEWRAKEMWNRRAK